MATMAPPSEYEEDAERIDEEYVPDHATSDRDIQQALDDAGFPGASQEHISEWLVSSEDVWPEVGPNVQDASSVRRTIDQESGGTVSSGRADQIASEISGEINKTRAQIAQRVDDHGNMRDPKGRFFGDFNNVEESVSPEGITYTNTKTGNSFTAEFDR